MLGKFVADSGRDLDKWLSFVLLAHQPAKRVEKQEPTKVFLACQVRVEDGEFDSATSSPAQNPPLGAPVFAPSTGVAVSVPGASRAVPGWTRSDDTYPTPHPTPEGEHSSHLSTWA